MYDHSLESVIKEGSGIRGASGYGRGVGLGSELITSFSLQKSHSSPLFSLHAFFSVFYVKFSLFTLVFSNNSSFAK